MIDLTRIESYRENNRIEAKKALGGLPKSLWETYSAFANTFGGVILLGVREDKDKSLHPVRLPNPEQLLEEFWRIINDKTKISVNILTKKHVEIATDGDKRFIAITVPRANRKDKPVYIGADPYLGSYRRNGEGDYRCDVEEIKAMLRDATKNSRDMRPFADLDMEAFNKDSVIKYRLALLKSKPHTVLESLNEETFLEKIGAATKDENQKVRPTGAGLLMLGTFEKIKEKYPYYRVCFEDRVSSLQGNEKELRYNLFDAFIVLNERIERLLQGLEKEAQIAATETLTNCLVNADYDTKSGIYVTSKRSGLQFSNPGGFRLSLDKAKAGGVSDPRNMGLLRLFQQLGVGNGTGSGIPNIISLWGKENRGTPVIKESFSPERVTVFLPYFPTGRKNLIKTRAGKESFGEQEEKAIIEFLTERIRATVKEICESLRLPSTDVTALLEKLTETGVLRKDKNTYTLMS